MLVFAGAGAMVCAAVGTALLRTRAQAWGLMDVPNERSLHTRVTPRGGGVVVVLTVLGGLLGVAFGHGVPPVRAAAYAAGAVLVAGIGWRDDLRSVTPGRRLLTHLLAAAVAVGVWGTFHALAAPGAGEWRIPAGLAVCATVLWLVGLVNAYNFMDGIDGLAAGQAVIAGLTWSVLCGSAAPLVTAAATFVAGASLGFLWHNWSPARIFMGDAGSGFLGFSFAVFPLMAFDATGDARLPVAGALIVAPFLFDTVFTLARRLKRRENVVEAHRSHLYQRLVTSGRSHAAVSLLYLGLATASGAAAVSWVRGMSGWILLLPVAAICSLPLVVSASERSGGAADG
ncbi:MAG TPA: glycosyltransferase family 4 protein [Vicinamibacterales bacterium]|nr:glycosyltransferase family 4 protein [Vicinamibacterales bacterium]